MISDIISYHETKYQYLINFVCVKTYIANLFDALMHRLLSSFICLLLPRFNNPQAETSSSPRLHYHDNVVILKERRAFLLAVHTSASTSDDTNNHIHWDQDQHRSHHVHIKKKTWHNGDHTITEIIANLKPIYCNVVVGGTWTTMDSSQDQITDLTKRVNALNYATGNHVPSGSSNNNDPKALPASKKG